MDRKTYTVFVLLLSQFGNCLAACNSPLGLDVKLPSHLKLPDSRITASSNEAYRYAKYGRLNNKFNASAKNLGAWCAMSSDKNSWLQIDFGRMVTITAVATQPMPNPPMWVEMYSLSYSYDGINWYEHKSGNAGQSLVGNNNGYDTVTRQVNPPITARVIRILPLSWHMGACLRTEFYGCVPGNDCKTPVGVSATLMKIPDENIKASSIFFQHFAHEGRLNNTYRKADAGSKARNWGAWCASKTDEDPYLQIDLGRVRAVSGVATQGYMYNLWTTQYRLNYSVDGMTWKGYKEDDRIKHFTGNIDNKSIRMNMLKKTVTARYVRFNPTLWNGQSKNMPCLRVEVYECLPIAGSVPTIQPTLSDITVKRGTTFNLTCGVRGQPGAQVAWKRDGLLFSTTDRISIVSQVNNNVYYSSLGFKNVKMAQHGKVFSCVAWYPATEVQAISSAAITVLGSKPVILMKNTTKYSVDFALDVVGSVKDDIRAYEVKLNIVPWSRVSMVTKIIPFNSSVYIYNFTNLKPYSRYKMSVAFVYLSGDQGTQSPSVVFRTLEDAPSGPPTDLQLVSESENSVKLAWKPPDHDHRRGQITLYHILWQEPTKDMSRRAQDVLFNTTELFILIQNLRSDSQYIASVRASTKVGHGPFTAPLAVYTLRAKTTTGKPDDKSTSSVTKELKKINEEKVDKKNAVQVTQRLENITAKPKKLKSIDVKLTADILEKVVEVNESTHEVGEAIVETVSNVLDANASVLEESRKDNNTGTRYVKILETWLEKVKTTDGDVSQESRNVVVKKVKITKNEVKKKITFKGKDGSSVEVPAGAIIKPTEEGRKEPNNNRTIFFVSYKNAKFFRPVSKVRIIDTCDQGFTTEAKEEYSAVISSSVPGKSVKNLTEPIVLKFRRPGDKTNEKIGAIHCAYWQTEEYKWSTKGCKLHSIVNDTIVCHCDHMTNFAAMMDVYAHTSKACGEHGKALGIISIIGCFLSLIGLFLTMLTYSMFRRLRKELAAQVLIQLCFALFVVMIVFLAGVEKTEHQTVCLAVAVLLHYFSLVAFMWMLIEAILMFQAFVLVWPPHEDNDIIKCSIAAWGIPGLIVSVTLVFGLDNYGGKHYCRINTLPFYVAFLGPVCLILGINIFLFITIMYKLSTRITSTVDRSNANAAVTRLKRAFGILILVGLTWSLGVLAISHVRLVFQYLFAICNSLQGFAIFIFYCISQKNARDAWISFIKCDMRSELKIRTESYYERRRLSSGSKTNNGTLLTRTRTNSSSMAGRNEAEPYQNTGIVLEDGAQMQTILEIDISNDTGHHLPPGDFICDGHLGPYQNITCANASASSAEDELLKIKPAVPLEPYRSYRALSGARSYDVLEMAELGKKRSSSKSNEALLRKSMILGQSSPLVPPRQKVRPTKSCDHLVKPAVRSNTPLIDFDSLRKIDQAKDARRRKKSALRKDSNTSSLTDLSSHSSDTLKAKRASLFNSVGESLGTLVDQKPRSISTSAVMGHSLLFRENPRAGQNSDRLGRSQDEIMKWLHDTESADDIISSDEPIDDFKSGISRSHSDISERTTSVSSTSTYAKAERQRRKAEKAILDELVVAPIRGTSTSDADTLIFSDDDQQHNRRLNTNCTSPSELNSSTFYDSSDSDHHSNKLSDEGYSASGEDILEGGKNLNRGKRPKRRSRSRKGSGKKQNSSFV